MQAIREWSADSSGGEIANPIPSATCPRYLKSWGRRRRLMIDCGSSVHMLRRDDLTQTERECIGKADEHLHLSTVNGPTTADDALTFDIENLKINDEAMILDNAPPGLGVLSMGRCVEEYDCAVRWTKKHGCLFMNPEG